MPKGITAIVEGRAEPMPGAVVLWLQAEALSSSAWPGQFVMLRAGAGLDPYLRLPVPIHRLTPSGVALFAQRGDAAHTHLATRSVGDTVDLLGPLGRAPSASPTGGNLGLLAQARGMAPLPAALDRHTGAAQLVTLAATERQRYPRELLPANLGYAAYTGAAQEDAFWESAARLVAWADRVLASGSMAFYKRLAALVARERLIPPADYCHVWVEHDLACGGGACGGCTVPTRQGTRRVCTDGPFLPLNDLVLDTSYP